MNTPCGGTVGPDFERSFNSYNLSISAGTNFPRPTSSSAPTILRTIYRKKDLPCTVNQSSSPSSVRRSSVEKISRCILRSLSSPSEPVEAANDVKSCLPTNRSPASSTASPPTATQQCRPYTPTTACP